jgi:hypothetical protein
MRAEKVRKTSKPFSSILQLSASNLVVRHDDQGPK